jgi:hypothetical protein
MLHVLREECLHLDARAGGPVRLPVIDEVVFGQRKNTKRRSSPFCSKVNVVRIRSKARHREFFKSLILITARTQKRK